jgi:hypothetical protein
VVEIVQVRGAEQTRRARDAAHGLRDVVKALSDLHRLPVLVTLQLPDEVVPARAVATATVGQHVECHGVACILREEIRGQAGVAHARVVVEQQCERRPHAVDREVDGGCLALRLREPVHDAAFRARDLGGVVGAAVVHEDDALGRDLARELVDRAGDEVGAVTGGDHRRDLGGVRTEAAVLRPAEQLDQQLQEIHERAEHHHPHEVVGELAHTGWRPREGVRRPACT